MSDIRTSFRSLGSTGIIVVLAAILSGVPCPAPAQAQEESRYDRMIAYLKEVGHFSKKELGKVEAGEIVSKTLDSDVKHEVVVLGVAHVDVPPAFFLENYGSQIPLIETQAVLGWGMLDDPPSVDNLKDFSLDPRDVQALQECASGDCNMKIPVPAMERFHNEVDWSAGDAEAKANDLTRQMLVAYAKVYLEGGNASLVEYHDQENPVRLVEEFKGMLEQTPELFKFQPEFYNYLENFPEAKLPNVRDYLYWAREDVGANYNVSSLNHVTVVIPEDPSLSPVIAAKQIYATHYFEAGLGLTGLVANAEASSTSFYLFYLNRSRVDALRRGGFTTKIIRRKLKSGMNGLIAERLLAVKTQANALYRSQN